MKLKFTLFLTMPLLLLSSIATGQAEHTFVKSFNLQGKQSIVFNLGDNLQVVPWESDLVRIQMTVTLASSNEATLKGLAETGRYTLRSDIKEQSIVVSAPLLQNLVKLNGNLLKESIIYVIYAPKGVTVLKNIVTDSKIVAKVNP